MASSNNGPTHSVKIKLSHATGLPAADITGTSDPYITIKLDDQLKKSSCRPATCDPVWSPAEQFEFTVSDPETKQMTILVFDHDLFTPDDVLGGIAIDLKDYLHGNDRKSPVETKGFPIKLAKKFQGKQLNSQLFLSVRIAPVEKAHFTQEIWENEYWTVGTGWGPGTGSIVKCRSQWSSDDGRVSSSTFEKVAPKVPEGYTSDGWAFEVGRGDAQGWYYSTTFAGPWYHEKNATSMVRRRKWTNACSSCESESSAHGPETPVLPAPLKDSNLSF